MTLNLTVAARSIMLQTSDFRLTRAGTSQPVSDVAQKQVVLHYEGWSGLVCYTGIAAYDTHDTAEWLKQVLTGQGEQPTVRAVVGTLVREGNKWLSKVPAQNRRHTFILVAYVRRTPHVYAISNHQWLGGADFPLALDEFKVDHATPMRPRCFVTGYAPAVTQAQRVQLESAVRSGKPPPTLRELVARASADASARAMNTVSEACVSAHLLPDGSGEAQVFGNLPAEFIPTLITRGQDVAMLVPTVFKEAQATSPQRLVGVTWTANAPKSAMLAAYRALSGQMGTGWPSADVT